jgi:hypothetical protein
MATNWAEIAKHDPVVEAMLRLKLPMTRKTWLSLAHLEMPVRWTAEHEAELPEVFQDWSKVKRRS